MKIEFVTHASVLVHTGDVHLLTDPWIEGTAFDNGWSLLSPPPKGFDIFREATHVWFSHEHPDHFAPPVLKKVPPEVRARLTVLIIETADKKVVNYCRMAGFGTVMELAPDQWHPLSPELSIMVGAVADDSWCALRTPALKAGNEIVLNVNDCCLQTSADLQHILKLLGASPDVLLTQFSYAQWCGNPDDPRARRDEARRKLNEVRLHIKELKPRWVIPFASFVWFSHTENLYLNDSINRIDYVADCIRNEMRTAPVVLYPGDVWSVGEPWDSEPPIERYLADHRCLPNRKATVADRLDESQLQSEATVYLARARKMSGAKVLRAASLTGLLPKAHLWISDLERAYSLSVGGLQPSNRGRETCDVELSSAALSYVLRFNWGGNTLEVNARFAKPKGGDYRRFQAWIRYGDQANHGRPLSAFDIMRHVGGPVYHGPVRSVWRAIKSARRREAVSA